MAEKQISFCIGPEYMDSHTCTNSIDPKEQFDLGFLRYFADTVKMPKITKGHNS